MKQRGWDRSVIDIMFEIGCTYFFVLPLIQRGFPTSAASMSRPQAGYLLFIISSFLLVVK